MDISHNRLESISSTVRNLFALPDLKMLYVVGNPLMLSQSYRQVLKSKLNKLKILDGTPTLNEAESTKKKKSAKGAQVSALSAYSKSTQEGPDVNLLVSDILEGFTLDLHLRVLQNVDGVYLTEETCKPEVLDTIQNDQEKSSVFWLQYTDHRGKTVESERKVWI